MYLYGDKIYLDNGSVKNIGKMNYGPEVLKMLVDILN